MVVSSQVPYIAIAAPVLGAGVLEVVRVVLNSSSRFRTNHNNMQQALHMYTLICHRGKSDAQPWRHTGPRRHINFYRHREPPGERREQQAGPSWQHRAQARSSAIARCSVEGRARGNWPVSQSVISRSLPESPTAARRRSPRALPQTRHLRRLAVPGLPARTQVPSTRSRGSYVRNYSRAGPPNVTQGTRRSTERERRSHSFLFIWGLSLSPLAAARRPAARAGNYQRQSRR